MNANYGDEMEFEVNVQSNIKYAHIKILKSTLTPIPTPIVLEINSSYSNSMSYFSKSTKIYFKENINVHNVEFKLSMMFTNI